MKLLTLSLMALACFAQAPLPELHTDAVDAGSIFRVKNNFSKPLVAYSIELVGYPGSFYTFIVDHELRKLTGTKVESSLNGRMPALGAKGTRKRSGE